jgi:iron complex transport system substrate-binding protein
LGCHFCSSGHPFDTGTIGTRASDLSSDAQRRKELWKVKILSLLPSATEILYSLGLEDALVGVTDECDWPPSARAKRIVSTTSIDTTGAGPADVDRLVSTTISTGAAIYKIDEVAVRSIQPDLILAQDLCRVCAVPSGQVNEALARLGCSAQVLSLDPSTLEEVIGGIDEVGRATGQTDRAEAVTARLRAQVKDVTAAAARLPSVPTLALEWPDPPFIGGHWIPEMVRVAGGRDVLGREGEPSRRVTWEQIVEGAPEVVVYMPCGYGLDDAHRQAEELFEVEEFASLPAAERGQVFAVDASSYMSRPGPRLVDGLEILAWVLHPDTFARPPAGRVRKVDTP